MTIGNQCRPTACRARSAKRLSMRSVTGCPLQDALAAVNTSLSPRPHKFITMIWSLPISGARLMVLGQRVRRLQRRNDALDTAAAGRPRAPRSSVAEHVLDPARCSLQPGMLRADARIVEPGRDRMGFLDLAVAVLQQIGAVAVQHAGRPAVSEAACSMPCRALAGGLDADHRTHRRRGTDGTGPWRWSRRRCRRPACPAGGLRRAMICSRTSSPMTDWKSRTIAG